MNGQLGSVVEVSLALVFAMLSVAMALAFIRLVRGPSLPDRVVALDLFATLTLGFIAVFTIATNQAVMLRSGIVLALLAFLGTVAFSVFIQKRASR